MKEVRVWIVIQFWWINSMSFCFFLFSSEVLYWNLLINMYNYIFLVVYFDCIDRIQVICIKKIINGTSHTPSTQKHSTHGLHEKHTAIYTLKSNIYSSNNTQHREITHQIGIQLKRFKWFNRINTFDSAFSYL